LNIIITGGSSGIGLALKNHFVSQKKAFGGDQNRVWDISRRSGFDLSTYKGIAKTLKTVEEYQPIDLLINNAGLMYFEEGLQLEKALEMLTVNLTAVWILMNGLKTYISHGGNIINIASVAGISDDEDTALYSATKAAVISLTKSYAKLLVNQGIRVNCISPGLFAPTNLVPGEPVPDELIQSIPMKRAAEPAELIPIINMILESKYMTGANIVVDGGKSL
jgi:NAD(P)-dependent dehydrogenase (short-subunit alcohol dehydrogenase family)